MKKLSCVIFLLLLFCVISGCSRVTEWNCSTYEDANVTEPVISEMSVLNETLKIYDINNKDIAEIEHYGNIIYVEDFIIYSKMSNDEIDGLEYYKYNIETKENITLGTIKDISYQSNECVHIGNKVYFLVCTGEMSEYSNRTSKLISIDILSNEMSEVYSEVGGFPYDTITTAGNKIYIAKVLLEGSCLEEYNVDSKESRILKTFTYNNNTNTGEVVRQVSSDGKTISLLILDVTNDVVNSLRVDIYDMNMSFLKSIDLSTVSNDDNELRQGVSFFEASNDYIYYENFSITRYLGLSTNGELNQVIETSELFSKASETGFNKNTKLFCEMFSENNKLYLFDVTDNTLMQADFEIEDDRYYIISLARNAHDKILISMYYKDPDTGETLEPRLYYFKLSDLKFENLN